VTTKLEASALDRLFRTARTRDGWTDRPVSEEQLRELYDVPKFGPTSSNCCPARFVWVTSEEGKRKLAALAAPGNAEKKKSNFICSIGYGSDQNLFPRNPRLSFEEASRFA